MDSEQRRVLGSPPAFVILSIVLVTSVAVALVAVPGPATLAIATLVGVLSWRALGASVWLDRNELVVRNVLRTFRFPLVGTEVRPRVVDPRLEFYSPGDPHGYPDLPTTTDDNTVQAAKWYLLEHDGDRYFIDALMGRSPGNHERLAWRLRQEIIAARDLPAGSE